MQIQTRHGVDAHKPHEVEDANECSFDTIHENGVNIIYQSENELVVVERYGAGRSVRHFDNETVVKI